jgi:hypothetical protein
MRNRRFALLAVCTTGALFASGCALAQQILSTISNGFNIVGIWT